MTPKNPVTTTTTQPASPVVKQPQERSDSVVSLSAAQVAAQIRVARFRGRPMVMVSTPYPHFVPLHRENFDRLAYPILGGVSRSRMADVFAYLGNTAEDLSENDRYILFGIPMDELTTEADTDLVFLSKHRPVMWDTRDLTIERSVGPDQAIWRSPHPIVEPRSTEPVPFILSLAGGDPGLYDDIMQSLAPLVMDKKPDGVIWWVGDGANGKSTLMDALYKIFPGQLSSINVKRLTDGRDTPSLNGTLANIVKESSEGRIEDTEIYKSIGTHENFRVHKFHSQDDMEIRGNLHHIFSANSIPSFNDKGYSARRRTFIIPFTQRFESDPGFEEKTFTPTMFGRLIAEMCRYAVRLRKQGYRYKWSATTLAAKGEYDTDANNAEEYAKELIASGVVGFENYSPVANDYINWCADNGYVPLGVTNLRRAMASVGFERITVRVDGKANHKIYRLPFTDPPELQPYGMGRQGMYTITGFKPDEPVKPTVPEFKEPDGDEPPKKTVLKGEW